MFAYDPKQTFDSLWKSRLTQTIRETGQVLRPPEREKFPQIGNAEIRHQLTQSRHCFLGFRQSPGERAAGGAYTIGEGVIRPIAHRLFRPGPRLGVLSVEKMSASRSGLVSER